jgi:hypothetical protein
VLAILPGTGEEGGCLYSHIDARKLSKVGQIPRKGRKRKGREGKERKGKEGTGKEGTGRDLSQL